MKSKIRKLLIAALLQILFAATVSGQKYENGTKLLKGAEVLSATPLQLDYVLETLADTAKITVNLHEGKTHLVLDDGSGQWREWWYHEGRWKVKIQDAPPETDPTVPYYVKNITPTNIANWNAAYLWGNHPLPAGLEGSIQTKWENNFSGSALGINNGFIGSLSSSDVGLTGNNTFFSISPQGIVEHRLNKNLYNFRSSLSDTTFFVKNRITFDTQPESYQLSIMRKRSQMNLTSKWGGTLSQIGISSGGTGIELFTNDDWGFSRLKVLGGEKGIEIFSQNMWGLTNKIQHDYKKSSFIYSDELKSRELSLNDATMDFITKDGSATTSRFYVNKANLVYYTDDSYFSVDGGSLIYRSYATGRTWEHLSYGASEGLLRIRKSIGFVTEDGSGMPTISLTNDKDIRFTRNASPYKTITLTEIVQKGQIIEQSTEPVIPDNSFAFWVNGSTFYLILRSGGVQKKIQFD